MRNSEIARAVPLFQPTSAECQIRRKAHQAVLRPPLKRQMVPSPTASATFSSIAGPAASHLRHGGEFTAGGSSVEICPIGAIADHPS